MLNRNSIIAKYDPNGELQLENLTDEELQINFRKPDDSYRDILINEYPRNYTTNTYQKDIDDKYLSKVREKREKKEKEINEKNRQKLKEYEEMIHYQHRNSNDEYKVYQHHEYRTYNRNDTSLPKEREINFVTDKPENFDNNIFIELKKILGSTSSDKYRNARIFISNIENMNHSKWIERISFKDSISFKELILQKNEESYELVCSLLKYVR